MSEQIRDLVFETWGNLCQGARTAGHAPVLQSLCSELMQRIVPRLSESDSDVAALKTRTLGVAKCLSSAGPGVLDAQQVQDLGQLALQLLSNSLERRTKHEQQLNAKKTDAQDLDETRDEEDDDEE